MRVHFIAIGGSVMHNLAIALKNKGYQVTGSDDDVFEPSYSALKESQILPEKMGWFPEKIHSDLEAVILGMHAQKDNPELLKAKELGVPVYSFPEYIYQQSLNKHRVVVAGSHGKTSVTSIILHVLNYWGKNPDYLLGGLPSGMETNVKVTNDASTIICEGDEYPSSRIDSTPKCINLNHHCGIITGIAWDHINVYPTFENYLSQFQAFVNNTPKAGELVYNAEDPLVKELVEKTTFDNDVKLIPYKKHKHKIKNGQTFLISDTKEKIPVFLFGDHNMLNISAALHTCRRLGVSFKEFYEAIATFEGTSKRMEKIGENQTTTIFKDFAHAPSKLKATTAAFKKQFPHRKLTACMELHTYSSLNKNFIHQYDNTMNDADEAIVYYNPETVRRKKLTPIEPEEMKRAFNNSNILVFTDSKELEEYLLNQNWEDRNLVLMSSGNFNNINLESLSQQILQQQFA